MNGTYPSENTGYLYSTHNNEGYYCTCVSVNIGHSSMTITLNHLSHVSVNVLIVEMIRNDVPFPIKLTITSAVPPFL